MREAVLAAVDIPAAQPHFSVIFTAVWLEVLSCSPSWVRAGALASFFHLLREMFGFLLSSGAAEVVMDSVFNQINSLKFSRKTSLP